MLFYKGENKERESSFSHVLTIGATTTCKKENRNFRVEKYKREKRGVLSFSDPMIAFLDAEKIKGPLVFRSFDEHEKFWPYGAKGPSKVNDFLKKQKHSKFERMLTGVVSEKKGEILWIAGLRIGHQFRITPQTREILKISCKPG
jgi:hypothetical protein